MIKDKLMIYDELIVFYAEFLELTYAKVESFYWNQICGKQLTDQIIDLCSKDFDRRHNN